MKSMDEIADIMQMTFEECKELRSNGQKEYAHNVVNGLSNFERLSSILNIPREQVLFIYMFKHLDGISSYINGHRSQRESVFGRINDVIVYLVLLRAMILDTLDNETIESVGKYNDKSIYNKGDPFLKAIPMKETKDR